MQLGPKGPEMATSAVAAVAAAVGRAQREVREHFEDAGALSPDRAASYDPPSNLHEKQFQLLVGRGVLRDAGNGRFWIDRQVVGLEADQRRRALKMLLVIILAGLGIAAIVSAALLH